MSDISNISTSNPNMHTVNTSTSIPKTSGANTTALSMESDSIKTSEYGPIVSQSMDGDTVRVKDEGSAQTLSYNTEGSESYTHYDVQDFAVESSNTNAEPVSATSTLDRAAEIIDNLVSYASISDSELKLLYLRGDISISDFEQEIEKRAAKRTAEGLNVGKFDSQSTEFNNMQNIDTV